MSSLRTEHGAFIASVIAHCVLVASGAWLFTSGSPPEDQLVVEVGIEEPPEHTNPPLGVGSLSAGKERVLPREPDVARTGGQHASRPDVAAPGRGGQREGERASNLSSSVDPLTLERETPNHVSRSEVQRLAVARVRRTKDDRRATPHPMELDFVASGRGSARLRRPLAPTSPSPGFRSNAPASARGSAVGADPGEEALLAPGSREAGTAAPSTPGADGRARDDYRVSAAVITARPSVTQDRAAVPAAEPGRASDTMDSQQRVASRVAALMQASALGGTAPSGVGGEPAPTSRPAVGGEQGPGARSTPSGVGPGSYQDLAGDPGLQGYYRGVLRRLDDVLREAFPRWAIAEGKGGLVVFDLTLASDGRVARVALVRPSGIDEYDRNVVDGVQRIASFGRVPPSLGSRAVLRISWDSINPVVGRRGPGPGHRPR